MKSPIVHSSWVGVAPLTLKDVNLVNEVPRYFLYFLLILDRVSDVYIEERSIFTGMFFNLHPFLDRADVNTEEC